LGRRFGQGSSTLTDPALGTQALLLLAQALSLVTQGLDLALGWVWGLGYFADQHTGI
jgi:hypothetical protein